MKIYANENLKGYLELLESLGYRYIVKAKNKFISRYRECGPTGHVQLMAVKNLSEVYFLMADLKDNNSFNNVKYCEINNHERIKEYTKDKTFTICNDW